MSAKKTTTKKTANMTPAKKAAAAQPTRAARAKPDAKPKTLSAIDAAAKVLAESKQPMTTHEMIEAMAVKGLWTSPGGATPHATLFSALIREIKVKGKDARFTKTGRGKFSAKA